MQFKPENSMRLTNLFILSIAIALLPASHSADAQGKNNAGKALNDFFESEWDYEMEQNPTQASFAGRPALERSLGRPKPGGDSKARGTHGRCAGPADQNRSRATFARGSTQLRPVQERSRDRYRRSQIPHLPDADQSARRPANFGRTGRSSPVRNAQGLRRLGGPASRLSGPDRSTDRADARRGPDPGDVAQDRAEPRPGPDRQTACLETGGEPVFQTVHKIPRGDLLRRIATASPKRRAKPSPPESFPHFKS